MKMATSQQRSGHKPNALLRAGEWKEILDITEDFRRLEVDGTTTTLSVDRTISPNLPTAEDCIRTLTLRMEQPFSSAFLKVLQERVDQLRRRMLVKYIESVSHMVSFSAFTGRSDSDVQREYSRSVEIWFDQAIEELSAVITEKPKVSSSFSRILHAT
jgi:hypothetical protein